MFRIKRHSGSGVRSLPDVFVPGIPRARALPRCGQIYGARNMATRWLSGLMWSPSTSGWRSIQVHSLSVLLILMNELHARATNLRVSWSFLTNLRVFVPRLTNCLETCCSWSSCAFGTRETLWPWSLMLQTPVASGVRCCRVQCVGGIFSRLGRPGFHQHALVQGCGDVATHRPGNLGIRPSAQIGVISRPALTTNSWGPMKTPELLVSHRTTNPFWPRSGGIVCRRDVQGGNGRRGSRCEAYEEGRDLAPPSDRRGIHAEGVPNL